MITGEPGLEPEDLAVIEQILEKNRARQNAIENIVDKTYLDIPDDLLAKLQLLHGDIEWAIVPKDSLRTVMESELH